MTNNLLLLSPIRFVAQLVEQLTLNQRAEGSNPSKPTLKIKHLHIHLCRCFLLLAIDLIHSFTDAQNGYNEYSCGFPEKTKYIV